MLGSGSGLKVQMFLELRVSQPQCKYYLCIFAWLLAEHSLLYNYES